MRNLQMDAAKDRKVVWQWYILTFLLVAAVQIISYIMGGYYPFGDKTLLIWDMDGQYVSYFSWMNHVLKGQSIDTLLYSFSVSYGGATIGLLGYYLLSPFNILLLPFSGENLPIGIQLVILCKIACCGVSMYYFLSHRFSKNGYDVVLFSLMYAMMGYNVTQEPNVMWLDGVIILPVLLLWVFDFVKGKHRRVLPLLIAVAIITDFYIAYMVMIFAVLYFFAEWFLLYGTGKWKKCLQKFFLLVLEMLIGVGLSCAILFPVLGEIFNVGRGGSGGIAESLSLILTFDPKFFMLPMKELLGAYDTTDLVNGLPNIYISLFGFLLFLLYLLDCRHDKREKLSYGLLLAVLLLSFMSVGLNQIWHGFTYTSGCPYRYSFCISFLMIVLGYLQYQTVEEKGSFCEISHGICGWGLLGLLVLWGGYAVYRQYTAGGVSFSTIHKWEATVAALCAVLFLLFWIKRRKNGRLFYASITLFLLAELSVNMTWSLSDFTPRSLKEYRTFYSAVSDEIQELAEKNHGSFYRVEHKLRDSLNDAMLIGYPSITHYSSVLQDEVAEYAVEHDSLVDGIGRQATEYQAARMGAEKAGEVAIKYLMTYELPENMDNWKIIKEHPFYVLENKKFKELCYFQNGEGLVKINVINSGKIHVDAETNMDTMMITSVPYREGWSIMVDGEECEPKLKDSLMTVVPLSKGRHSIEMQYHQPKLRLGCGGSIVSLAFYILYLSLLKRRQNNIVQGD